MRICITDDLKKDTLVTLIIFIRFSGRMFFLWNNITVVFPRISINLFFSLNSNTHNFCYYMRADAITIVINNIRYAETKSVV